MKELNICYLDVFEKLLMGDSEALQNLLYSFRLTFNNLAKLKFSASGSVWFQWEYRQY